MQQIDPKAFWTAVGQRALGASVVTARGPQGPAGFLGLSTAHVCADPPTMLVSIDKRTAALDAIREARHFAISYLASDQGELAEIFGGRTPLKGADRFGRGTWTTLSTGAPVLADAAGAIDCTLEETLERHGVVIALGRVVDFAESTREPLVMLRGRTVALART
ncbi:MAG TPA: flavin reductase family protein [Xanthobacteraceae bacterium]|nr:flavin reductase family protein [Xanthobacteraceae bacterium]